MRGAPAKVRKRRRQDQELLQPDSSQGRQRVHDTIVTMLGCSTGTVWVSPSLAAQATTCYFGRIAALMESKHLKSRLTSALDIGAGCIRLHA